MKELTIHNQKVFELAPDLSMTEIRCEFPAISESETKKFIAMIFTGLKFADRGEINSAMALEVYAMALDGKAQFAVEAATKAFLTGTVPDASRTFVPSTAELVTEVERQFWLHIRFKKKPEPEVQRVVPANHFTRRFKEVTDTALNGKVISDD